MVLVVRFDLKQKPCQQIYSFGKTLEFNAICFNESLEGGGYLRPHLIKNFKQHAETLLQFQNRQQEYDDYIEWFKQLPLFYESPNFRVVHASWHTASIEHLREVLDDGRLTENVLHDIEHPISPTLDAIEKVLKGLELPLPPGTHFHDKDGQERHHIRYKWWLNPAGRSFDELSILPNLGLAPLPYPADWSTDYYEPKERPVFCGHYWLRGQPVLQAANVCCLDYSVAKQGKLVSYRYEGELTLVDGRLVW